MTGVRTVNRTIQRMLLRRRLALLAVGYLALLSMLGGVALWISGSRSAYGRKESRANGNLEQALRLSASYVEMETANRGYLITGNQTFSQTFLEAYRNSRVNVARLQAGLSDSLSTGDPPAYDRFRAVASDGAAWRAEAGAEIAVRKSRGQPAIQKVIGGHVGAPQFDRLRVSLAALSARLETNQRWMTINREHRARQLAALVVAFPIFGFAYTVIAAIVVNRWVLHPIRAIAAAARQVIGGDLSATVPSLGATDVAVLGSNVDEMRSTMVARLNEASQAEERANRAREAIEQSTTLVFQLRSELASELGSFPEGWTAAAELVPAEGYLAGDCYDVSLVSPHVLGVIVLDIAGHGAAQAITALKCREILRAALRVAASPSRALDVLAERLGDLQSNFLTAFVALIDTRTGSCRYSNAGHPPALLATKNEVVQELSPTGPLIGPFHSTWRTETAEIEPGGKLCVYTDGLTEARDAAKIFYGMERLASLIITLPCEVAEPVVKACFEDLRAFSQEQLHDDVTMVLICRECEKN